MAGQERAVDLVAVEVDKVAGGVGHLEAVPGEIRRPRAQLRRDVPVTEERLEAAIAAWLIGQRVGHGRRARRGLAELHSLGRRAESAALRAVHGDADVV